MTVIRMSERELTRLRVLIELSDRRLTFEAASTLMGLGRRKCIDCGGPLPPMARPPWCHAIVRRHHDGVACTDDIGHPANEDIVDVDHRVGQQAIHLFRGMFWVQATCSGEALADRADGERSAAQHAEGGITERVDALGVKVVVEHTAQDLPNMIEGEPLLPDDHRNPRLDIARGQTRRLGSSGESPQRSRKNVSPVAVVRFFPESPLRPPDFFMPYRNEGMSERNPLRIHIKVVGDFPARRN
jgi:hypothetical protein